jgi:pyridoxine kinase
MNVLSLQSWVAYGRVGNAAALFTLQRLGIEAWGVNTVAFSNHPAHGRFRGRVAEGEAVAELVQGLDELGVVGGCDAVLSGYLGDAAVGAFVLDAGARVKRANPAALYCCDPVIGDAGRIFVRPGVPELMREHAVPACDIATPNQFELELLTGATVRSLADGLAAADALRARGPGLVVVTSLRRDDAAPGTIETLAVAADAAWLVATPLVEGAAHGAGDAFAALFLGHYLQSRRVEAALGAAVSAIHAVLEATRCHGATELLLVAAQDELVRPTQRFAPRRVR